jgi:hypothetical protein
LLEGEINLFDMRFKEMGETGSIPRMVLIGLEEAMGLRNRVYSAIA